MNAETLRAIRKNADGVTAIYLGTLYTEIVNKIIAENESVVVLDVPEFQRLVDRGKTIKELLDYIASLKKKLIEERSWVITLTDWCKDDPIVPEREADGRLDHDIRARAEIEKEMSE